MADSLPAYDPTRLAFHIAVGLIGATDAPPAPGWILTLPATIRGYRPASTATDIQVISAHVVDFVLDRERRNRYRPPEGTQDLAWLRYRISVRGDSMATVAEVLQGKATPSAIAVVEEACASAGILQPTEPRAVVHARTFLGDREWLLSQVNAGLSDGGIAEELRKLGAPVDRSTVASWRARRRISTQQKTPRAED